MCQIGLSGEYIRSEKKNFCVVQGPWPLTLKLHSMSLHICFTIGTLWVKHATDWTKGREDTIQTRFFKNNSAMTYNLWNMVQDQCTPFTQRHFVDEVWATLGKGKSWYASNKRSQTGRWTGRLITKRRLQGRALMKVLWFSQRGNKDL